MSADLAVSLLGMTMPTGNKRSLNPFKRHTFLFRIHAAAESTNVRRIEQKLAEARLLLVVICLLISFFPPADQTGSTHIARSVLLTYLAYSLFVLWQLGRLPRTKIWFPFAVHVGDVALVVIYAMITTGRANSFFILFVFVFLGAVYRWGLTEAIATALTLAVLLLIDIIGFEFQPHQALQNLAIPVTCLIAGGIVVGLLTEEARKAGSEATAIGRILAHVRAEAKLSLTLRKVCSEVLRVFGARQVLLAVEDIRKQRLYLWQATSLQTTGCSLQVSEIEPEHREKYFFAAPPLSWSLVPAPGRRAGFVCNSLLRDSERIRKERFELPGAFRASHPALALLACSSTLENELRVRFFLLDPRRETCKAAGLNFLHSLFRQVGPAVFDVYLARKNLAGAANIERASLARELHDNLIQSLVGIELKMEVLARRMRSVDLAALKQLEPIQEHLHHEILNLRRMMHQLKSPEFRSRECIQALRCVALQYQDESGINTRFETGLEAVRLPPPVCGEMVRILREALINARKHSAPDAINVRLDANGTHYVLEIRDNGRGFDFEGRLTLAQLDAQGKGPVVLRERVRHINGDLAIESEPGKGSCLEIRVPLGEYGFD